MKLVYVVLFTVLPSFAAGAIHVGISALTEALPYQQAIDDLANRNMAYWFLSAAAVAIASWTWIAKWLIRQLEEQRKANAEMTGKLLDYMSKDHATMCQIMERTNEMLGRTNQVLEKVLQLNWRSSEDIS